MSVKSLNFTSLASKAHLSNPYAFLCLYCVYEVVQYFTGATSRLKDSKCQKIKVTGSITTKNQHNLS